MLVIVGYAVILFAIIGGYIGGGGHLEILFQPYEFVIIIGCSLGAFVCGNSISVIKAALAQASESFKSTPCDKTFYFDLLVSFNALAKIIRKEGLASIETIVDGSEMERFFTAKINKNHHLMEFIRDYLRLISIGIEARVLEELMDQAVEMQIKESNELIKAVKSFADAMPAFGIVAAVLGVVHAMDSIGLAPHVLGNFIAAALVGTFLGILLAYGFISPIANIMEERLETISHTYKCAQKGLLCCANAISPMITVEHMRILIPAELRPSIAELAEQLKAGNNSPAKSWSKINKML